MTTSATQTVSPSDVRPVTLTVPVGATDVPTSPVAGSTLTSCSSTGSPCRSASACATATQIASPVATRSMPPVPISIVSCVSPVAGSTRRRSATTRRPERSGGEHGSRSGVSPGSLREADCGVRCGIDAPERAVAVADDEQRCAVLDDVRRAVADLTRPATSMVSGSMRTISVPLAGAAQRKPARAQMYGTSSRRAISPAISFVSGSMRVPWCPAPARRPTRTVRRPSPRRRPGPGSGRGRRPTPSRPAGPRRPSGRRPIPTRRRPWPRTPAGTSASPPQTAKASAPSSGAATVSTGLVLSAGTASGSSSPPQAAARSTTTTAAAAARTPPLRAAREGLRYRDRAASASCGSGNHRSRSKSSETSGAGAASAGGWASTSATIRPASSRCSASRDSSAERRSRPGRAPSPYEKPGERQGWAPRAFAVVPEARPRVEAVEGQELPGVVGEEIDRVDEVLEDGLTGEVVEGEPHEGELDPGVAAHDLGLVGGRRVRVEVEQPVDVRRGAEAPLRAWMPKRSSRSATTKFECSIPTGRAASG